MMEFMEAKPLFVWMVAIMKVNEEEEEECHKQVSVLVSSYTATFQRKEIF